MVLSRPTLLFLATTLAGCAVGQENTPRDANPAMMMGDGSLSDGSSVDVRDSAVRDVSVDRNTPDVTPDVVPPDEFIDEPAEDVVVQDVPPPMDVLSAPDVVVRDVVTMDTVDARADIVQMDTVVADRGGTVRMCGGCSTSADCLPGLSCLRRNCDNRAACSAPSGVCDSIDGIVCPGTDAGPPDTGTPDTGTTSCSSCGTTGTCSSGSCLYRRCDGRRGCYASGTAICSQIGGVACPAVPDFSSCAANTTGCATTSICLTITGLAGLPARCTPTCTTDSDCNSSPEAAFDTRRQQCLLTGSQRYCFISCTGPLDTCPSGGTCRRYSDGTYGFCF